MQAAVVLGASEHAHKGRTKKPRKHEKLSAYGKWYRQWRALLVRVWGSKCQKCGVKSDVEDLEFAHIGKTPLSGAGGGRGSYTRLKDILDHPEAYLLLCNDCHAVLDGREGRE